MEDKYLKVFGTDHRNYIKGYFRLDCCKSVNIKLLNDIIQKNKDYKFTCPTCGRVHSITV